MRAAADERSCRTIASRLIRYGLFAALITNLMATRGNAQSEGTADPANRRLALVVGQSDYRGARLVTGTADASRIAEALQSAGFSVDGAADIEQQLIREKVRALVEKAMQAGGAETILVYFGGRVAQINGENLLLPVGAPLERGTDVVLNGFRLNDLVNALKLVPAKARIIVIDAAAPPEHLAGDKLFSPGLAIVNAPDGFLIAFNQNPGRPLLEPQPPTGFFLRAFLDALQQPVASYGDSFALARQRVFEESQNRELPWEDDKLAQKNLAFFPPPAGAALPTIAHADGSDVKLASMTREEAFKRVIASDSIVDYQAFLIQFPKDDAVPAIQYNLAVRREAEIWSRALLLNTKQAYWTYLNTYPDGGNAEVARQKLEALGASASPPEGFGNTVYNDLPPPLPPQVEMIASSASMPIEYLPPPPKLGLPPIAAAVAAAVALPVAAAMGKQLPHATGAVFQPSWSAAPRPAINGVSAGMARPVMSGGQPIAAPVHGTPAFQPVTNSHGAPSIAPGVPTFHAISTSPTAGEIKPIAGPITAPAKIENPNKPIESRIAPAAEAHSNFAHQPGNSQFQRPMQQQQQHMRAPQAQRSQGQRRR